MAPLVTREATVRVAVHDADPGAPGAGSAAHDVASATTLRSTRNLQLDVLRGVAILLVFGRHLELARPEGAVGSFAEAWFRIGWLGVDLFFVLSGFLIGGLLIRELRRCGSIDITRFLVRRGLKIYPAYFVFIAYLILVPTVKALASGGGWSATLTEQWIRYWPNLLFLQNYIGSNPAGHTWSLAVEEHFYLLLPFAMVALASTGRVRLLVPLCLLAVPALLLLLRGLSVWSDDAFAVKMSATHLRLDALLFGVGIRTVAEYFPEQLTQGVRRWRYGLIAAGLLLWSLNLWIEPSTAFVRTLGLMFNYVGSAALLLAACHIHATDFGRSARYLSPLAESVAWIGFYSYTIYLWHVTAMGILGREIGLRLVSWQGAPSTLTWLAGALAACVGAVLVGVLASRAVEWPLLRLRDRMFPSRLS